jgi:hypothetical protein
MNLIAIGQELMGTLHHACKCLQNKSNAHSTPEVMVGSRNNCQQTKVLMVYFGTPNMFITLWFGFVYRTNLPLGTLIM